MTHKEQRGTGRTTEQLKAIGVNGVFVWCNVHTQYPKRILKALGREDVKVVTPSFIKQSQYRGLSCDIQVDHAAREIAFYEGAHRLALLDFRNWRMCRDARG